MKVKKEVFESLRLELQEFTPQEFVAGCYRVTIPCTSKGYVSTSPIDNKATSHPSDGNVKYLYFRNQNEPERADIVKMLGTGYTALAYSSSGRNFHSSTPVEGFYYESNHFSQWSSVSIISIATSENPNVSG